MNREINETVEINENVEIKETVVDEVIYDVPINHHVDRYVCICCYYKTIIYLIIIAIH